MNLITEYDDDGSKAVWAPQIPEGQMNVQRSSSDSTETVQSPQTPGAETSSTDAPNEKPKTGSFISRPLLSRNSQE